MSIPLSRYPEYVPLAPNERCEKCLRIKRFFDEFAKAAGYGNVLNRDGVLIDIVERVEKRRVYFRVFHNIVMSERNEISLYCFWILKLAPFFNPQDPNDYVNVRFASFLFLRMVSRVGRKAQSRKSISREYVQNLYYAFLYQDISKEAIMLAADTLLA